MEKLKFRQVKAMVTRASAWFVLAVVLGAAGFPAIAQDDRNPPKELIQYIRDAEKAGLKTPQIRQNALNAGWPEAAFDNAVKAADGNAGAADAARNASVASIPKDPPSEVKPAPAVSPAPQPAEAKAVGTAAVQPPADPKVAGLPAPSASIPAVKPELAKPAADLPAGEDYLIGEGDVLAVLVFGEATASVPSATVRPDGKISMPLIKDIPVAGMTPAQVESMIQEKLKKVIQAPDVTVVVSQINSKKIFLTGAVKREGPLKYTYKMSVLQAISEAGGLTDYAKRKKIYVLHTEDGREYRYPFDYPAVLKGEHLEQNRLLYPGDTIVVP